MKKPTRSLLELEEERAVPWGDSMQLAWHGARYELAREFVAGKKVLDLGSGEGYGADLLSREARQVVGIDYAPVAVEHARQRYANERLSFETSDLRHLDHDIGRFDVVTCFEVIEHIADHDALLKALVQHMEPGGVALFSTPNNIVLNHGCENPYHVHEVTPSELKRTLKRHFERVELRGQVPSDRVLRAAVKSVDIFGLGQRLRRSEMPLRVRELAAPKREDWRPPAGFRFSRLLIRDALIIMAVARGPRPLAG